MASTLSALYEAQTQIPVINGNVDNGQDANTFRWQARTDKSHLERLEIKEAAVKVAIEQGGKVAAQLQSLATAPKHAEGSAEDITIDELKDWSKNYDETCRRHGDSRVFVGVAGATGAGKTSLLNALLDIKDLLPTSDEAAATAVVCIIAWNNDDNPNHQFKAQVIFKDHDALVKELDLFFQEFKERNAMKGRNEGRNPDLFEDEEDTYDLHQGGADVATVRDIHQADANLDDYYVKIAAIWGLEEHELTNESTESLLNRNPDVLRLLGTTKEINEADDETFAMKVKPYMDSTVAEHGIGGETFAAWPLIDEVRVFVKADILRNGVVLVDLPGLADAVESRQAVAKRYFTKLTLTAIIAPITRAADEQTGISLMSEHQEVSMQMDGKYHKKAFCVVLSKMDEIDVDSYLRQHMKEAKADEELQGKLRLLKQYTQDFLRTADNVKKAKKACRTLKQKNEKAQKKFANSKHGATSQTSAMLKRTARTTSNAYNEQLNATSCLEADEKRFASLQRTQDGFRHFWCLRARNRLQHDRFTRDFARRQRRIALVGHEDLYDGKVRIFPVSASVYWKFSDAERITQAPLGFPDRNYTGIPALKAWLCQATAEERERHLDTCLNTFLGLLNGIRAWSTTEWSNVQVDLRVDFIKQELIEESLKKFQQNTTFLWKRALQAISGIDALAVDNMNVVLDDCQRICVELVKRWNLKDPMDMRCKERIHYLTYGAIINRQGGTFISKGKSGATYCWNRDMASIFLKLIAYKWNDAFNNRLPTIEKAALEEIEVIWGHFLKTLRTTAEAVAPGIMPLLDAEDAVLGAIGEEIKNKLRDVFKGIREHAAEVHPRLQTHMQREFAGAYKKAQKKMHKGHFQARQAILQTHARRHSRRMYQEAFTNTGHDLNKYMRHLPSKFNAITDFGEERIKKHTNLLLSNVTSSNKGFEAEGEDTKDPKEHSRVAIRQLSAQWAVYWRIGRSEQSLDNSPTEIPDEYAEKDSEDEDSDENIEEDEDDGDGDYQYEEEDDDDEE